MQPVCNNGDRRSRRGALGAVVLVWLHLLLPWIHHVQHAGCSHGSQPAAAANACACGHAHARPEPVQSPACEPGAHDASQCVVCHQLRLGNPLLGGDLAAPRMVAAVAAVTSLLPPTAPPRFVFVPHAPPRGPPLPV